MKCWPWEYFRTSVASRAILGRRGVDERVVDFEADISAALAARGPRATADCVSVLRNLRRVTVAWPAFRRKEAMADSVFIETGGDSAQFQEASQRSAHKTCRSILCSESPTIELGGSPGRVPGAVLRIESVMLENQRVILRFMARAGVPYTLSYKPDLSASNWIPLDELPPAPTPGLRQFENEAAGATQQRYYRISSP